MSWMKFITANILIISGLLFIIEVGARIYTRSSLYVNVNFGVNEPDPIRLETKRRAYYA